MAPLLDIKHQRDENLEKESTRNRFPIYCFKAIVNDGSATTSITCFSDHANMLTSTTKRPDFILDTVFKNPTLALPAPVPTETPEPQTKVKSQETFLLDPTEVIANKTNLTETTTSQQTNPQLLTLTSPKSASTKSETQEPKDEESMQKGDGKNKLPKTSVQKALFGKDPEPNLAELYKK
ncbi:hypothetical protein Tco_0276144 [Tanacetum coccineum]